MRKNNRLIHMLLISYFLSSPCIFSSFLHSLEDSQKISSLEFEQYLDTCVFQEIYTKFQKGKNLENILLETQDLYKYSNEEIFNCIFNTDTQAATHTYDFSEVEINNTEIDTFKFKFLNLINNEKRFSVKNNCYFNENLYRLIRRLLSSPSKEFPKEILYIPQKIILNKNFLYELFKNNNYEEYNKEENTKNLFDRIKKNIFDINNEEEESLLYQKIVTHLCILLFQESLENKTLFYVFKSLCLNNFNEYNNSNTLATLSFLEDQHIEIIQKYLEENNKENIYEFFFKHIIKNHKYRFFYNMLYTINKFNKQAYIKNIIINVFNKEQWIHFLDNCIDFLNFSPNLFISNMDNITNLVPTIYIKEYKNYLVEKIKNSSLNNISLNQQSFLFLNYDIEESKIINIDIKLLCTLFLKIYFSHYEDIIKNQILIKLHNTLKYLKDTIKESEINIIDCFVSQIIEREEIVKNEKNIDDNLIKVIGIILNFKIITLEKVEILFNYILQKKEIHDNECSILEYLINLDNSENFLSELLKSKIIENNKESITHSLINLLIKLLESKKIKKEAQIKILFNNILGKEVIQDNQHLLLQKIIEKYDYFDEDTFFSHFFKEENLPKNNQYIDNESKNLLMYLIKSDKIEKKENINKLFDHILQQKSENKSNQNNQQTLLAIIKERYSSSLSKVEK